MATSIDITFTHYNRPPTEHLHFRVLTRVFQVHLLWRTKECADITIFSSQLLPARISIFDQNQEAEIFKSRWRRQSEFKNQLNLTSKILARMLHIADILFFFTNFASEFKTAEPLLRGQRAGGGVESAIKNIACHSLSPSFFCNENTQVGTIAMSFAKKVKVAQMTLIPSWAAEGRQDTPGTP